MKMNSFACMSAKIIFLLCILLQVSRAEETDERVCLDNGLSPDDESEDGAFNTFATKLESYTGLSQPRFEVDLTCEVKPCIINPDGTAIWDARMYFYLENMMSNNDDDKYTLDGCLCYSQDLADYQVCMEVVRKSMTDQLDTVLIPKFREIVEANCTTLYVENCE